MSRAAVQIIAHGRVQGVWYRASAQARARELNLCGWVRNRSDGTVEAHAEGERDRVEQFVEWCRQGPPAADVSGLDYHWVSPEGFPTFEVK